MVKTKTKTTKPVRRAERRRTKATAPMQSAAMPPSYPAEQLMAMNGRELLGTWLDYWPRVLPVLATKDAICASRALVTMSSINVHTFAKLMGTGESQARELVAFEKLYRSLPQANVLHLWRAEDFIIPPAYIEAAERACAEVRELLDRQPNERLPARADSLLASLAVSVLDNGGVMLKQRAHEQFTGRDKKADGELSKLMTPEGRWSGFGLVHGDVLRMSDEGKRHAEHLKSLGARPLADRHR